MGDQLPERHNPGPELPGWLAALLGSRGADPVSETLWALWGDLLARAAVSTARQQELLDTEGYDRLALHQEFGRHDGLVEAAGYVEGLLALVRQHEAVDLEPSGLLGVPR